MNSSSSSSSDPFPPAPAPWTCRGEAFWLFAYTSSSSAKETQPPAEAYGDVEREEWGDKGRSGEFKGGFGTVQLVRYTETPVGPYDELMWCPGRFGVPGTSEGFQGEEREGMRITRIYVSNKGSVYNGRKNWNIPKTLAVFTFNPAPLNCSIPYDTISVALPETPKTPFFTLHLSPLPFYLSSLQLPFTTALSPIDMTLIHPPLPQSPRWREDAVVGTKDWIAVKPKMVGKLTGFLAGKGLRGALGDGREFPRVSSTWSVGVWWRGLRLEFPMGEEVVREQKEDDAESVKGK
ncbi:hypothetical protein RUND412_006644 [Rhizina undulata]